MRTKILPFLISLLLALAESGCSGSGNDAANPPLAEREAVAVAKADFTKNTPLAVVTADPAFGSFGRLLFPVQSS